LQTKTSICLHKLLFHCLAVVEMKKKLGGRHNITYFPSSMYSTAKMLC
jgi:hypothetical protein